MTYVIMLLYLLLEMLSELPGMILRFATMGILG